MLVTSTLLFLIYMLSTSASFSLMPNGTATALQSDGEISPATLLDDVLGLALLISQAPVVALAIGQAEMHLKAQAGVELPLPLLSSFCQLAGPGPASGLAEVADLTHDSRLAQHPAVVGAPQLRFCASIELQVPTEGRAGTLYFLNTKPQQLSAAQRDGLLMLARQATTLLASAPATPEKAARPTLGAQARSASDRPEIFVKHEQRFIRLLNTDIQYVEALGDYVNIYTANLGRLTQYATMKEMERKLPFADFARVHRKYIVRLDRIMAIEGDVLHVDTGRSGHPNEIAIGSSYKSTLLNRLNLL